MRGRECEGREASVSASVSASVKVVGSAGEDDIHRIVAQVSSQY